MSPSESRLMPASEMNFCFSITDHNRWRQVMPAAKQTEEKRERRMSYRRFISLFYSRDWPQVVLTVTTERHHETDATDGFWDHIPGYPACYQSDSRYELTTSLMRFYSVASSFTLELLPLSSAGCSNRESLRAFREMSNCFFKAVYE